MSQIFLVRHARPSAGWGGSEVDPGLDGVGQAQAVEARAALLALARWDQPIGVASSPMRRCLETAAPLAKAMAIDCETVAAVGEIPTPRRQAQRSEWLGQALRGRWADIRGDIDYQGWRRSVHDAVASRPGFAIFTHFVAINAVVSLLAGDEAVTVFRPAHASITILEAKGSKLELIRLGAEATTGVL